MRNVVWIDPKTGKRCEWKQCKDKFTIEGSRKSKWTPNMFDGVKDVKREVIFDSYYHECSECSRRVFHFSEDKKKTKDSYMYYAYGMVGETIEINDVDKEYVKEMNDARWRS